MTRKPPPEGASPRTRHQGYLAGRSAVLLALLVLAALLQGRTGSEVPFAWFFGVTAAAFAFTLASALPLRRGPWPPAWAKAQPAWDVAYATALVYLTGGAFSPFAGLYALAIIGGAILLYRRGALVVATASSLAYGCLVDLQHYGLLRPLNPFPLPEVSGEKFAFQLVFNLIAFYAVAALSGYLAEELRRTGERLEVAEAEVLDLEHLRAAILQSLGSGLIALDRGGRELFHNRSAEELLARAGVRLEERMDLASVFDLAGSGRSEARLLDGQLVFGYAVSPLADRDGRPQGSLLIFQDLTQVKHLEEELRRSDRLAAVGRLAAGLAHEVRNPLASLSGSVEVLRHSRRPEGEEGALFEIVLRETERLNRLVTNFLHYARPGRADRGVFPLHDLVAETAFFFCQGEGKHGFLLENEVPAGLTMAADRGQIEQLLLNLFRNSVEAGGEPVTVRVTAAQADGWLQLAVSDDGPGMPPERAERAFEPFFTSKSGGTGLGLATVHRIVENHGGSVALETAPGRGATFRFRFPAG